MHKTVCLVFVAWFSLAVTGCKDEESTPNLPQGCQAQGVYAIDVIETDLRCLPTNAYSDPSAALGAPDEGTTGDGKLELFGIVSLGVEGSVTLYMGSCIQNLAGADLRVYQAVSEEAVEVQVSQNQEGPFVSLGTTNCRRFCDFDLEGSGLQNPRFVRVFDREKITFPGAECDNTGPSPGADIDSVEVLHPAS